MLEEDLWLYARFVLPQFSFGDIHRDVFQLLGSANRLQEMPNILALIPRDHLKSVMVAVYSTWRVARNPAYTILYITANEDLGKLQMSFIQNIFQSKEFRTVWPEHFIPEMGRRDKWTGLALNTDHPLRVQRNIRDETIAVKTVKADKTGRHPDEIIYDDLVVPNNAYTELGRTEVRKGASEAVSLAKSNALMTAVGTVYHPRDQYTIWKEATYQDYTDDGVLIGEKNLWHVIEHQVEDQGDGTGTYLWPRVWNPELKEWFGWDIRAISKKKAEYINNGESTQFYAQYYMEANDPSSHRLKYESFNYWTPKHLLWKGDRWEYAEKPLSISLFMDVATTDAANRNAKKADFSALAVIGIDTEGFYYVLQLEQFQTDQRSVYYDAVIDMWKKWGFKRMYIEQEGAGRIVAEGLKEHLRKDGYSLIVEGKSAPRGVSKAERHASITIPRYEQGIVLHPKGGWTIELEEQLVKERPAHDDLLDVVTMGIETLKQPYKSAWFSSVSGSGSNVITAHNRFGGRRG